MFRKSQVIITISLLALFGTGLWLALWPKHLVGRILNEQEIRQYAENLVGDCRDADYGPVCYEEAVPKLMNRISMEDALAVTRVIQQLDPTYGNCHVLAHKISFEESRRSGQNYTDIIPRCPTDSQCNYGCIHGPLIEHFRGEVLTDAQLQEAVINLKTVCEPTAKWDAADLNRTMCYHALGHLAMYITGGKPDKAKTVCQNIASADSDGHEYEICVEGVFMTVFQSADAEDLALVADIKPDKDEVEAFCTPYTEIDFQACRRESYPLFREDIKTPQGLVGFCRFAISEHEAWKCYATAIGDIIIDKIGKNLSEEMTAYCLALPQSIRQQCFANVAGRLVQLNPVNQPQALEVCQSAATFGLEGDCYQDLVNYSRVAFKPGSVAQQTYCQSLPDSWRQLCLEN